MFHVEFNISNQEILGFLFLCCSSFCIYFCFPLFWLNVKKTQVVIIRIINDRNQEFSQLTKPILKCDLCEPLQLYSVPIMGELMASLLYIRRRW